MRRPLPFGPHLSGKCENARPVAPAAILACAARFGLQPVDLVDIEEARTYGANRLGEGLASASLLRQIQDITKSALFAFRSRGGALCGVFAGFPLGKDGAELCAQGRFNAHDFDPALVAAPERRPYAWYGWGFVASSKRAAYSVVSAARAIQSELFAACPAYARAVTPEGAHITHKIGYRQLAGADPGLVWIPARPTPAIQACA